MMKTNLMLISYFLLAMCVTSCDDEDQEDVVEEKLTESLEAGVLTDGEISLILDGVESISFSSDDNNYQYVGMYAVDSSSYDYLIYAYNFDWSYYGYNYFYLYINSFPTSGTYTLGQLDGYLYFYSSGHYAILGGGGYGAESYLNITFSATSETVQIDLYGQHLGEEGYSNFDTIYGYVSCSLP